MRILPPNMAAQILVVFEICFLKIFLKKSQKTSLLKNYKDLNSHIWRQGLQLLRVLWQHPTTRLRISNFEKQLIKIFWKFLKKSQKTSYLEKYRDLSSHIWRQDSQSLRVFWQDLTTGLWISDFAGKKYKFSENFLKTSQKTSYLENYKDLNSHIWRQGLQLFRVLWQHPTTRLRISNFEKQLIKIFWKFLKKSQKTSYLENYKELSSHIWRQDSQSVKVLWQHPTTRLGISNFERKIIKIFWNFLKKSQKDISKITRIWAFIFGGKIRNLWEHSDRTQLQGWEFQILWKKINISFLKIFLKKSQKRHISKTIRIWTVIFEGKDCNSLEYSDSTQLQGWEFQILRNN